MSNLGEATGRERNGTEVPLGESGELKQPWRHEEIASAIVMYVFALLFCGLCVVALVAAWRWAL